MIVTSQSLLANELRISLPMVKAYFARGMPNGARGEYDSGACIDWLREPGNPWGRIAAKDEDKEALEKEQLRVKIDRDKLKLERESGALVERKAVWSGVMQIFHRIRARFQAVPGELGSSVPPECRAQVIASMKEKIVLILSELEHWEIEE